jgi:hypothetical protein
MKRADALSIDFHSPILVFESERKSDWQSSTKAREQNSIGAAPFSYICTFRYTQIGW